MKRLPKRGAFFMVSLVYFGKAPVCGTGKQGSVSGNARKYKIPWLNWLEHRPDTSKVEGSSPSGITNAIS